MKNFSEAAYERKTQAKQSIMLQIDGRENSIHCFIRGCNTEFLLASAPVQPKIFHVTEE
jgi:hypothetical protein